MDEKEMEKKEPYHVEVPAELLGRSCKSQHAFAKFTVYIKWLTKQDSTEDKSKDCEEIII